MATIKSYSDLQQSKKLAEILPIESADMYYHKNTKGDFVEYPHFNAEYKSMVDRDINYNDEVIPCWSLVALLTVLPMIFNNETLFIETSAALWHIGYRNIYTARADNPVDACYEMILKLNELKML